MKLLILHPEHAELFRLSDRFMVSRRQGTSYRGQVAVQSSWREPSSAEARRDPFNAPRIEAIPHGEKLRRSMVVARGKLLDVGYSEGNGAIALARGLARVPEELRDLDDWSPGRRILIFYQIEALEAPVPALGGHANLVDLPREIDLAVTGQFRFNLEAEPCEVCGDVLKFGCWVCPSRRRGYLHIECAQFG